MATQLSLEELNNRLDTLWIQYLNYLDTYTTAQKTLQTHLSAGFLSLARANFNARDGVTRYGRDFYHERIVATKRVAIASRSEWERLDVEVVKWEERADPETKDDEEVDQCFADGGKEPPTQQPSPPTTPEPENKDKSRSRSEPTSTTTRETKSASKLKPTLSADPLRWFGILVPRQLRSAQASFSSAVDDAVADAANSARRMRDVEAEIRKLRKEIRRTEKTEPGEGVSAEGDLVS